MTPKEAEHILIENGFEYVRAPGGFNYWQHPKGYPAVSDEIVESDPVQALVYMGLSEEK